MAETATAGASSNPPLLTEKGDDEIATGKSNDSILQQRLRRFKQKANQARQLNQQAVRDEATAEEQQQQQSKPKPKKKQSDKISEESAAESIQEATRRQEKDELNQYQVNDYHNPGGQYRNYVRSLKSVAAPTDTEKDSSQGVFRLVDSSVAVTTDDAADQKGAHRVAEELHRRYAKAAKRAEKKRGGPDVEGSYINKRNKKFNEKISRNYDQHTAEIRQNLERGTAL